MILSALGASLRLCRNQERRSGDAVNRALAVVLACLILCTQSPEAWGADAGRQDAWLPDMPTFSDLPGWPVSPEPLLFGDATYFGPLRIGFEAPTVFLAHTFDTSNISIYLDRTDSVGPLGAQGEGRVEWSTRGNWIGLSQPLRITDRFRIALKGLYFIPAENSIQVEADGRVTRFISGSVTGQAEVVNQWFMAELEAAHQWSDSLTLLAGVRYDYLSATSADLLKILPLDPRIVLPIPPQRIDAVANSVFPYVGIQHTIGLQGDISITAKGFPSVIISPPRTTASGYFAELQLDYSPGLVHNILGHADASVFARMNLVHAVFREVDVLELLHVDPLPPLIHSESEVVGVHWQGLMAGLNVTLRFDFPTTLFPFP